MIYISKTLKNVFLGWDSVYKILKREYKIHDDYQINLCADSHVYLLQRKAYKINKTRDSLMRSDDAPDGLEDLLEALGFEDDD